MASQILRMAKCSVSCDNNTVDVKPKRIHLEPSVKFEVLHNTYSENFHGAATDPQFFTKFVCEDVLPNIFPIFDQSERPVSSVENK